MMTPRSPLKVRYMSDVHLEFTGYEPAVLPSIGEDVVVLAGDMGVATRGIEWAIRAIRDRPVLYVLGNHEFYRDDFVSLIDDAKSCAAGTHVQVLENDAVDIGGVRFLGATLWTDFACLGEKRRIDSMVTASRAMNDFLLIRGPKGTALEPFDTITRFKASSAWLQREIEVSPLPVVVVTHHSPSLANQHPAYPEGLMTPSFHSDLEHLFKAPVQAWISGHTHHSSVVEVNGIPLYSNQRGYPRERIPFDWDACFEVVR